MLRRVATRTLSKTLATKPSLRIAAFASQADAGNTENDEAADGDEPAVDEGPERKVLKRRPRGPPAARRSRFQAVPPENKGILRRRLLDSYKENQLELPDGPPDVDDVKFMRFFHKSIDELEVEDSADDGALNLSKLGLIRQVVFTDSVNNVLAQGRTLNFRALVVVGNRRGCAGYAIGKGKTVTDAIERGSRKAMDSFTFIDRFDNRTLYHQVEGKWNSCTLFLRPTRQGRGLIVSDAVACVLNCFGIDDIASKCHGQRNPYTVVQAAFNALSKHKSADELAMMRGSSLIELSTLARMRNL